MRNPLGGSSCFIPHFGSYSSTILVLFIRKYPNRQTELICDLYARKHALKRVDKAYYAQFDLNLC